MLSAVSFGAGAASPVLAGLDDDLRDARRVLSHGQEEDLRYALDRVLNKVEELSSCLKTALKTQTELETQLNLARSNLQLVISNNEMLEEALKRETPSNARDVGWRRWSAREAQNHNAEKKSEDRPRSLDYGPLNESGTPTVPSNATSILVNGVKPSASTDVAPQPTTPVVSQDNRFFKFRFSSGSRSPAPVPHPSHLTSPSLSSLVPNAREKEVEELQEQLEREREARKTADTAKAALEAELESLSQALFEEANKMVATERMKRAETEEELSQTRLEKDALHQALKLIEGENGRLRSANVSPDTPSVVLPSRLSPEQPSPSRSPTGEVTPPIASYGVPSHSAGFHLEPAPKPPLAGLHRKTASMKRLGVTDLSFDSFKESLSATAPAPSVPFVPGEASPWEDATSDSVPTP